MTNNLKTYLNEISQYLYTNNSKDKEDILKEIEAYILEETKNTYQKVTEEGILRVTKDFGSPREVAKRYMHELQENTIPRKRFFMMLLSIVFAIHSSIYMFLMIYNIDSLAFDNSYSDNVKLLLQILSVFVVLFMDAVILLPITAYLFKKKRDFKFFKFISDNDENTSLSDISFFRPKQRKDNIILMFVSIVVFAVELLVYAKYKTLFVISSLKDHNVILADNVICKAVSIAIIVVTAIHFVNYLYKALSGKISGELLLTTIRLVLLWAAINVITFYRNEVPEFQDALKGMNYLNIVMVIVVVLFLYSCIRNCVISNIKYKLK
ncbi:HAAS signaling domain-containing protein [Ruminiclostridium papyrosolvens]|uniref:Uncharacterized protein n=1 Tax=Ruminiclostridium papyrosolvens C7 TaxID=1330534 RepID=U4R3V1_9FIRM|nr:hypothetical protein [Ruminiclostridium papyrosolvens]EPR12518.1 hypothetical protein L323_08195 [Ruminiclostridium papyrosolvens C7]